MGAKTSWELGGGRAREAACVRRRLSAPRGAPFGHLCQCVSGRRLAARDGGIRPGGGGALRSATDLTSRETRDWSVNPVGTPWSNSRLSGVVGSPMAFVTVRGARLHYTEAGQGTPVLFS